MPISILTSEILKMSKLTYYLLDSFDYDEIIEKRKKNFEYSRKLFDKINVNKIQEKAGIEVANSDKLSVTLAYIVYYLILIPMIRI